MRRAIGLCAISLLAACGAEAGVSSLSVEVNGVEVRCRAEIPTIDWESCRKWGFEVLEMERSAASVVITQQPAGGPCEVDFFTAAGDAFRSVQDIPCRRLGAAPGS